MTYAEPANMTGLLDIFSYANTVSDGIFGVGIVITLYIIVFAYLNMKGEKASDCFVVAGYITTIATILLRLAGLVNNLTLFIAILVSALPAIWTFVNRS